MNRLNVNDSLSGLHQQISASVEKVKSRSSAYETPASTGSTETGGNGNPSLQNYAYSLLDSRISYQLSRTAPESFYASDYAAGSYLRADEVLSEPTVLIDFMFENNREFDFKV